MSATAAVPGWPADAPDVGPVDAAWARALEPVADAVREAATFLLAEVAQGRSALPAPADVFRAFRYPMDRVRVLVVGQDPYPTPGNSMGLAFAVRPPRALPASLRNIFTELVDDVGCPPPVSGDLRPWAERGVMMLNRVLTVGPGAPGSHRGHGWEHVTRRAIEALVERGGPLVAVLWGRDAQGLRPALGSVPSVASVHPSPLSAYRGFFGSKPFSRVNALLEAQGAAPVDWSLAAEQERLARLAQEAQQAGGAPGARQAREEPPVRG